MTMPEATTDELNAVAKDPMQALLFAFEMLTAISQGHSYDALDFMMRRETISVVLSRSVRRGDLTTRQANTH